MSGDPGTPFLCLFSVFPAVNDHYDPLGKPLLVSVSAIELLERFHPGVDPLDRAVGQPPPVIGYEGIDDKIYLYSGTLIPLLKKLESKGYISRIIDSNDSRNLMVEVTEKGLELREKALEIPDKIACKIDLDPESAKNFYNLSIRFSTQFPNRIYQKKCGRYRPVFFGGLWVEKALGR